MEIIISILLTILIVTNITFMKTLKKTNRVEILPVLESTGCDCKTQFVEEVRDIIRPLIEEKTVKPLPKPDESHFAWKNQKEEPKQAPPSPHGPPPKPEPLARPYGFSR